MSTILLKPFVFVISLSLLLLLGCDAGKPRHVRYKADTEKETSNSSQSMNSTATQTSENTREQETAQPSVSPEMPKKEINDEVKEKVKEEVKEQTVRTETVRAEVGVTGKGDYSKSPAMMSPVTVPVSEYFKANQRAVFDMQIPKSMQIYKAMNDNKGPASHEEFMKSIIQENQIRLPELPDGHEYQYDPKTETLNIVRPVQ
ncbi:MAG: hypothetical protein ACRC10_05740 [Thermoguttaceae bacterium]